MGEKILVPALGESITEATVSKWLKNEGDAVNVDEAIVELETDKVNLEVPSPSSGILTEIKSKDGDTVEVGAVLGTISQENIKVEKKEKVTKPKEQKIEKVELPEKKSNIINLEIEKKTETKNEEPLVLLEEEPLVLTEEIESSQNLNQPVVLSPAVRKIVEENDIDISNIEGTGKDGRISKGDLINLMGNIPGPSKRKISHGPEEYVKMTKLRMTIAKRLKEAQDSAAMLTTFNEVDMLKIMQMKKDYQEDFQKKYSIKLGLMSFFVKASVVALKNFPSVNAEIEGDHIIYKNYYNISIAIGTDRGLIVPVLKNADELSFADIEKNIFLLSEKARLGKITINDLQGGTFTISNGGIYGSMLSTPILNPPQTGILGMHNIVERPIVREGNIVIRPIMYLALSYDHRLIDGKEAVSFLKTVKDCLEEPRRLFLDL